MADSLFTFILQVSKTFLRVQLILRILIIIQTQFCLHMQKPDIKQLLKDINLSLDIDTINSTEDFLLNEIGFIEGIQNLYQVYGGAAIVSEMKTLPNVGNVGLSKNGIKIENVMCHLGKLSKDTFLEALNKQLQKWKTAPAQLKKRVVDVKYSYIFYKKYQTTFNALFQQLLPDNYYEQQFSAMFWTLYLYVKNSYIQPSNMAQSKILLIILLRLVFQNCISTADFGDIFYTMKQNIGQIFQITQQKTNFYYYHLQDRLNHFYTKRFQYETNINFQKLMKNPAYLQRLMDDMSNEYARDQSFLKYSNEIDELSYLELKKDLTPQVFKKQQIGNGIPPIANTLNFNSDQDDQEHKTTPVKQAIIDDSKDHIPTPVTKTQQFRIMPISPITPIFTFKPKSSFNIFCPQQTPLSTKIQNQNWKKNKIASIAENQITQFKQKYQKSLQKTYSQFEMQIKQKNMELIQLFERKCLDFQARHKQMYFFFISNCLDLDKQDVQVFVKEDGVDLLKSLASLSSQLFNYTRNAICSQYKIHLEKFGVSMMNSFKPIQLFLKYLNKNMPSDLNVYLKNLEKRLIVSQIWENSQGYKILCQSQNPLNKKYSNYQQIYNKILIQGQRRVQQICRKTKIQRKINLKTTNMLKFILQKKPYLLRRNNIDQIILCCLMSCLSINQKHDQKTLQNLFNQYNSNIQYAYNSNQHRLKDNEGNQMSIVQFYNDVFLNQIQDMLNVKYGQLDDFLLTPVRIDPTKDFNLISPSLNGYKQMNNKQREPIFNNPQKKLSLKQKKASYIGNMLKRNSQMKQEKEEDQISSSPVFGGLSLPSLINKFSFGHDQQKK